MSHAAQLFLPAWWVSAYEASTRANSFKNSTVEQLKRGHLLPYLNDTEMNALSLLLSKIQGEILQNGVDKPIRIDSSEFDKSISSNSKSKRFDFSNMQQILPSVRTASLLSNGKIEIQPLFHSEKWSIDNDNLIVDLGIDARGHGSELILGYINPFKELIREATSISRAGTIIGKQAPINVWRSAWLDFNGIEQLLFLRIEKAMQWDFRWLQLSGVFGMCIDDLFEGISLPNSKIRTTDFSKKRNVISKLSKKLKEHGILADQVDDEFLALDQKQFEKVNIIWQASGEKLLSSKEVEYRSSCMSLFSRISSKGFVSELAAPLSSGRLSPGDISRLIAEVDTVLAKDSAAISSPSIYLGNSQAVPALYIYLEWLLRKDTSTQEFVVSDTFKTSDAFRVIDRSINLDEKLAYISKYFLDNPDYCEALKEESRGLLLSDIFNGDQDLSKQLKSSHKLSIDSLKLSIQKESRVKADLEANRVEKIVTEHKKTPISISPHIKKAALDELSKIEQNKEAYLKLKKTYLDSLDESSRKLILELQKMSDVNLFKKQLKPKLTKFMIENPSSWTSISSR